jgi:hypothetical protein
MNSTTSGSYPSDDVTFLVKLIKVEEVDQLKKEKLIQSGEAHYSEMIAREYKPTNEYLALFKALTSRNGEKLAKALVSIASHINDTYPKEITLVSLLRAGTPVGVLLNRILKERFNRETKHFAVSIVRDRGIDVNALNHILDVEHRPEQSLIFIDGWTAKGVITRELKKYISDYNKDFSRHIPDTLYVLSDIGGTADITASFEDYAIPSGVLNSTVSGLISRSIWNEDIGDNDFHGAMYYSEFEKDDMSQWFVNEIMKHCMIVNIAPVKSNKDTAKVHHGIMMEYISTLKEKYAQPDINMIKPGIAEATRVMLRRVPRVIILKDIDDIDVKHLHQLALDKNIPIEIDKDMPIKAVALISNIYQL